MGKFTSIEAQQTFLIQGEPTENVPDPDDQYGVTLKVNPVPDENFKLAKCLAPCPLYIYAESHDEELGSCTGPTGKFGNILHVSTPCRKNQLNPPNPTDAFPHSTCALDEENRATDAVVAYLWKERKKLVTV